MRKILAFLSHGENELVSSPSTHHNSLQPGKQFFVGNHKLTVENVIAEGGFGIVCRVRSQDGRVFAMKRTCVNNKSDLATVKREVTIVVDEGRESVADAAQVYYHLKSSLSHKNILKYIDSTITETEPGIFEVLLVTSYYPGSVAQVLTERRQKNQRFLETEVLRVLCDICEAVSRLHHCETPIIHRDLKIENILIDSQKNFVLCDFGSATSRILHPGKHGPLRCQEEIEKHTTLAYRAPEMVDLYTNGGQPIGPPVDIWALGCVVFGLCFFSLPFGANALAIQTGQFAIPEHSSYSSRLHKLIKFMLCVEAVKRPDIFQVASLAFFLLGRPNPVLNVNASQIPSWQSLSDPLAESALSCVTVRRPQSEVESDRSRMQSANNSQPSSVAAASAPDTTNSLSIARQRPLIADCAAAATTTTTTANGDGQETALLGKLPPPAQRSVVNAGGISVAQDTITPAHPSAPLQMTAPVTVPPTGGLPSPPTSSYTTPALSSSAGGSRPGSLTHSRLSSYEASQLSADLATRLPPPLPKPLPPPPFSRRKQLHRRGASDGSVLALFPDVRHSQSLGDLIHSTLPSPPVNLQMTPPVPVFSYSAAPLNSKFSGPATQPRPMLEFLDGSGFPAACPAEPCMLDADLFGAAFDAIRSETKGHSLAR